MHYIRFQLTPEKVERFASGPVAMASNHLAYQEATTLLNETHAEMLTDVRP